MKLLAFVALVHLSVGEYLRKARDPLVQEKEEIESITNSFSYTYSQVYSSSSSSYSNSSYSEYSYSDIFYYNFYYGWDYYYLSDVLDPPNATEVMSVLCDFISFTDVEEVYDDWYCDITTPTAIYCDWKGIHCVDDAIIGLRLTECAGTIPDSIGGLSTLKSFEISASSFPSSIPISICDFSSLLSLSLDASQFTGQVPNCIFDTLSLKYLDISDNQLTALPDTLGSCEYLQHLDVSGNLLVSVPDSVGNCVELRTLYLSDNSLNTIPNTVGNLINLRELGLSLNQLIAIPETIGNCANLIFFDAYDNQLVSLPVSIGNCLKLQVLEVSNNQILNLDSITNCTSLKCLKCAGNQLVSLPDVFSAFTQLQYLDVSDNLLNEIPALGDCSSLRYLDGNRNQLSALPDSIGNCVDLTYISISENELSALPESIGNCVSLRYLSIPLNYLNDLPVSIENCVELRLLDVADNEVFSFPNIGNCSRMSTLDLSNNALFGNIPYSIDTFVRLAYLDLSVNSISGTISEAIGNAVKLEAIILRNNLLTGIIPDSIGELSGLVRLDLHDNLLSGSVTDSIGRLTALGELYLSSNSFSGSIPTNLALLSKISALNLYKNSLTGKVPEELCSIASAGKRVSVLSNQLDCYEACWSEVSADLFLRDKDMVACAPTPAPTEMPLSPASASTESSSSTALSRFFLTIIFVCGFCGLLIVAGFILFLFYRYFRLKIHPMDVELTNMLSTCPIHKAIYDSTPLTPQFVMEHIETSQKRTPDGKTALDLLLEPEHRDKANAVVFFLLFDCQLPRELRENSGVTIDCMCNNAGWTRLIQQNDERSLSVVEKALKKYKTHVHILANATDEFGRKYINIASVKCSDTINRVLYLHERYDLFDGQPEYKTGTALVRFAYDHKRLRKMSLNRGAVVAHKVALKFMSSEASFKKELSNRLSDAVSGKYLITILDAYDGNSDNEEQIAFRQDAIDKGYGDYPYCIVMEAADQNLNRYIDSQRIAGHDWEEIKRIFKQLVMCVEYLHGHQVIHGDIKPNNVVLLGSSAVRLIDFDNSVKFGVVASGMKASTAYCPPEYFRMSSDFGERKKGSISSRNEVNNLASHPSQDMWALGALLYLFCTGSSLFCADIDDNISDEDDLLLLYEWSDIVRDRKLSKITDKLARNLVSLMLTKNVEKRIDAVHVLEHPFLSGKQTSRLQGDKAEFDVFISYRVVSDAHHAQMLFDALTEKGLKVWLDTHCLEAGKNWEIGFCEGLFKSEYFVCLISRDGMKNAENVAMNWEKLTANSACDNVMLEWMLALELHVRGLISGVFPVFIGSSLNGTTYDKFYLSSRDVPEVSASAIEEKLRSHLDRQGCGLPYVLNRSARSVVEEVVSNQGAFLSGELTEEFRKLTSKVESMAKRM